MTTRSGKGTLERALRRWRRPLHRVRGWTPPRFGADAELAPDSAFDVQMRERVRGLEEVKDRVNNLIFLVVGAVVVQVVLGFVA